MRAACRAGFWRSSILDVRIYFAHPYASWERGLSENTNGLVRQYLPKHRDLRTVTAEELAYIMNRLNTSSKKMSRISNTT